MEFLFQAVAQPCIGKGPGPQAASVEGSFVREDVAACEIRDRRQGLAPGGREEMGDIVGVKHGRAEHPEVLCRLRFPGRYATGHADPQHEIFTSICRGMQGSG